MHYLTETELRQTVEEDVLNPDIRINIINLLQSRNNWRKVSNIFETLGNLLIVIATVLSFTSGVYKNDVIAYVSGCVNIVSLSFLKFSEYSLNESEERNKLLNDLLVRININPLPSNIIDHRLFNTPNVQYY
jgi:hypothetical protein